MSGQVLQMPNHFCIGVQPLISVATAYFCFQAQCYVFLFNSHLDCLLKNRRPPPPHPPLQIICTYVSPAADSYNRPWLLYMYARIIQRTCTFGGVFLFVCLFVCLFLLFSPFPSSSTGPGGVWQEWCGPAPAGEDGRGLPVRRRAGRGRAHPQPGPCQAQQGRQGATEYIRSTVRTAAFMWRGGGHLNIALAP